MKTVKIMFTRGDSATQPGGLILHRKEDGEFATHQFNRLLGGREPQEFFWGHYFTGENAEQRALADFEKRAGHIRCFEITEDEIIARGG